MKHKVQCSCCGKKGTAIISSDGKIQKGWVYFGKLTLNSCATDKFFWRVPDGIDFCDVDHWEKVPNLGYNPNIKKKKAELWECSKCNKNCITREGQRRTHHGKI